MKRVRVELAARAYDVVIGAGASATLPSLLRERVPNAARCVMVCDEALIDLPWFADLDPGIPFDVEILHSGERTKRLSTVEALANRFSDVHLSRNDLIVAVGGGVVSDLAGFAAATYQRGIAYMTVATTLLSQVDASIGGKTGVNIESGKNLIGSFWQPIGVVCDLDHLATLPDREWSCGRGEMAKYAFLGVEGLATLTLESQVEACVRLKAQVVESDEREGGRRMILNYGHTLAHALEAAAFEGGDLRHGEAVAIGLHFAAILAKELGRIDQSRVDFHRHVIGALGLEDRLSTKITVDELIETMARDKKASHNLTFVLDGPRGVSEVNNVSPQAVKKALEELIACS